MDFRQMLPPLLVFFTVLQSHASARMCTITVLSPYNMKSTSDVAVAMFGVPDYGGFIVGSVVYPQRDSKGCHAFDSHNPFKTENSLPSILLLDRGDYYFALKVWNGQEGGARVVLVADNVHEPLITMEWPVLSAGIDIKIPSAFIRKLFGDNLKEALKNGEKVVVKIEWEELMSRPMADKS